MVTIFLTTLLSSYTLTQSSNNQAFATLENNDNKIADSIKKVCPNYEDNGNIKDIVSNILKACLNRGDTSQPPTEPNPEPLTPFDVNIMNFEANTPRDFNGNIIIKDESAQKQNVYDVEGQVRDQFVIPIGDEYVVNVAVPDGTELQVEFSGSAGCSQISQINQTACKGIMGNSGVGLMINVMEE
jgi:hypothetical protein